MIVVLNNYRYFCKFEHNNNKKSQQIDERRRKYIILLKDGIKKERKELYNI